MAATVPVEGNENPLVEAAQRIGLEDGEEPAEQRATASAAEPRTGSFESFMSSFGSPARWAGR